MNSQTNHLSSAQNLVQQLKPSMFCELMAIKNYPDHQLLVFEALWWLICGLHPDLPQNPGTGEPPKFDRYQANKLIQHNYHVIKILKQYGNHLKNNEIREANIEHVKEHFLVLNQFRPEFFYKFCHLFGVLCEWIIHIVKYFDDSKQVNKQ